MIFAKNKIYEYLKEYSNSHTKKINIWIHEISVPLNLHATIGLACFLPFPDLFLSKYLGWGTLLVVAMLIAYVRFNNFKLYIGIALQLILMLLISLLLKGNYGVKYLYILMVMYLMTWAAQLLGHKHEGKKPSFAHDLNFLLIGPLWVLANLYKFLKIKF